MRGSGSSEVAASIVCVIEVTVRNEVGVDDTVTLEENKGGLKSDHCQIGLCALDNFRGSLRNIKRWVE